MSSWYQIDINHQGLSDNAEIARIKNQFLHHFWYIFLCDKEIGMSVLRNPISLIELQMSWLYPELAQAGRSLQHLHAISVLQSIFD